MSFDRGLNFDQLENYPTIAANAAYPLVAAHEVIP